MQSNYDEMMMMTIDYFWSRDKWVNSLSDHGSPRYKRTDLLSDHGSRNKRVNLLSDITHTITSAKLMHLNLVKRGVSRFSSTSCWMLYILSMKLGLPSNGMCHMQ